MKKSFRIILGIILMAIGTGIGYLCLPIIFQPQIILTGFGIALSVFGIAIILSGVAILRGASIKETLLMLHLSS